MRRPPRLSPIGLVFALAAAATPSAAAQRTLADLPVRTSTLENGLQVVVLENPATPLATVLVAVHTGAFTQEPATAGIAHLYEHLLFRSYPGEEGSFWREVSHLNGRANGTTGEEVVTYFIEVPADKVPGAIRILGRLVREARFNDADLAAERPIVLDEIKRLGSEPRSELEASVERALWGADWVRKDVGGDSSSLAGVTVARLRETYARYYVPNNAALIVTGGVTADAVAAAAREHLGGWARGPDPFAAGPVPPPAPLAGARAVVLGRPVRTVSFLVEWQGPGARRDADATYAADVLFDIFNAPTSAFQQRLVDAGPFMSVSASYQTLDHTGPIVVRGRAEPERAAEALLALLDEIGGLDQLGGVGDEDLAMARKAREVHDALLWQHTAQLAPWLAAVWSSAGIDYFTGRRARADAETRADLQQFAQRYLVRKPMVIGIVGPPAVAGQLQDILRSAGAAPALGVAR